VAKSKTDKQPNVPAQVSLEFFSGELSNEETGVYVVGANAMEDPPGNESGSYTLDYDLVVPFPAGRITELYGDEGTGKTTIILEIIGRALSTDPTKRCMFVNMEKSLNVSLMRTIRSLRPFVEEAVSKKNDCRFWIVNTTNGEQALEAMRQFAAMCPGGIAALDSIDAAQPETVLAGAIGENRVGNHGKLMSDAMRKLIGVAEQNNVALIFTNQTRSKITLYGDPTTTPGGAAVAFYASQRIRLKKPTKADMITMADGHIIGKLINYKVVKNKFAPEGAENAIPLLYNSGIFREQELVIQCCNFGILRLGGKGGKQVYLPKLDRATNEFVKKDVTELDGTWMSQFNASRKLLLDPALTLKLDQGLKAFLKTDGRHDALDDLTDEVSDPQ